MNEITLKLTAQEAQIIITALQKTDPTGMYVGDLAKKISDQGNAQIAPLKKEVKEVVK